MKRINYINNVKNNWKVQLLILIKCIKTINIMKNSYCKKIKKFKNYNHKFKGIKI